MELAREFGTPLYVFDEETLRTRARRIRDAFLRAYERSRLVYAGKAYLSPALMRILVEEGIGLDVVSGGEIYAGLRAGVDPSQMIFHGNNKSRAELEEAVAAGVGLIAIDNDLEITLLESVARDSGRNVEVVLRLNPGRRCAHPSQDADRRHRLEIWVPRLGRSSRGSGVSHLPVHATRPRRLSRARRVPDLRSHTRGAHDRRDHGVCRSRASAMGSDTERGHPGRRLRSCRRRIGR